MRLEDFPADWQTYIAQLQTALAIAKARIHVYEAALGVMGALLVVALVIAFVSRRRLVESNNALMQRLRHAEDRLFMRSRSPATIRGLRSLAIVLSQRNGNVTDAPKSGVVLEGDNLFICGDQREARTLDRTQIIAAGKAGRGSVVWFRLVRRGDVVYDIRPVQPVAVRSAVEGVGPVA